MKHIVFKTILAAAASVLLTACGCLSYSPSKPEKAFIKTAADGYAAKPEVNQMVFVFGTGGSDARICLMERKASGKKWKYSLGCDGFIGKNGLGKTREGDGKTPVGDFGIIQAFGIKPNPGTSIPYTDATEDIWCCGDTVAYNRIIDIREYPHKCEGEHLIEYVPAYNYGFFIGYNAECTFGRGSAIFFHCTGKSPWTAGCVAVSEDNMVKILKALDSNARVIINYEPGSPAADGPS